jgi:FkbM family methyltransferase
MSFFQLAATLLHPILAHIPPGVIPLRQLESCRQAGFRVDVNWDTPEFNSQYGQDAYIWRTLFAEKQRSGFFVDIGAYDGATFSNSYFFERVVGFNGLLIEPNPAAFQRLASLRRSEAINCGVGPSQGSLEFIQCDGYGEQLSCVAEFATSEHLARIDEERRQFGFGVSKIKVPVLPIDSILGERGITTIDLLSLDVEGMELEILRTFPFGEVHVRVAAIESNSPAELEKLMWKNGFRLDAIIGIDHVYVSRNV